MVIFYYAVAALLLVTCGASLGLLLAFHRSLSRYAAAALIVLMLGTGWGCYAVGIRLIDLVGPSVVLRVSMGLLFVAIASLLAPTFRRNTNRKQ
jgi:glucose uptake protein GlcU